MPRAVTPHTPVERLVCGEFRRGENYTNFRPAGTPDWLLIYTLGGGGQLATADGPAWQAGAGDILLYEPRAYQDYRTATSGDPRAGRWHLRWAHFYPPAHWLPALQWPVRAPGLRWLHLPPGEPRERVAAALLDMVRLQGRREVSTHLDLAGNALEQALLWVHAAHSRQASWARMDGRVRRVVEALGRELTRPFSLPELAARHGLSVSRLAHLFKAQVGVSPQQFAERQRLERACHLLRYTGLSIGEIAAETGFEDAFYFSKRFRRHLGRSPTGFRRGAI